MLIEILFCILLAELMAIDIKLMVKCLLVCDGLVMFMPVYAMYWKIYADLWLIKSLGIENKGRKKKGSYLEVLSCYWKQKNQYFAL